MAYLSLLLCLILAPNNDLIQRKHLSFTNVSLSEGLSQSSVNCILQDRQGYIWIGTEDGLNKYDGYRITTYRHDLMDDKSISGSFIQALYQDSRGRIWIGTKNNGVSYLDPETGAFVRLTGNEVGDNRIKRQNVHGFFEGASGEIWIGTTTTGLHKYNPETKQLHTFRHPIDIDDRGGYSTTKAIFGNTKGMIWVATEANGLYRFDTSLERFEHFLHAPNTEKNLCDKQIVSLYQNDSGILWIGTGRSGLYRFDPSANQIRIFRHDPKNPHSISGDRISAITEDSQGKLWIGTIEKGLDVYDPITDEFVRYSHNPLVPNSLSSNTVLSLFIDKGDVIWVGTVGGGVNKWYQGAENFNHYILAQNRLSDTDASGVVSIFEDSAGARWLGTFTGGAYRINPATNDVHQLKNDPEDENSLPSNIVLTINEDDKGNIWLGTFDKGLCRYSYESNSLKRYDAETEGGPSHNQIRKIVPDENGEFWIGTNGGGIDRFNPETETFKNYQPLNRQVGEVSVVRNIITINLGARHGLWAGSERGDLIRYERDQDRFSYFYCDNENFRRLHQTMISSIHEDSQGDLWVGTSQGLFFLDPTTCRIEHYSLKDGLPNNFLYGILEDDAGDLWLSTNYGLSRFSKKDRTFSNFTREDGLQGNEFNMGAYFKSKDGSLSFGGLNGYNSFNPKDIKLNSHIPPIVFTSIQTTTQDLLSNRFDQSNLAVELSQDSPMLSVEVAALDFANPSGNKYAYQIEGMNDDWVMLGSKRDITFTNLPTGTYRLRVKGANNDNIWNETGTSIQVRVIPVIWQRHWAYIAYFLSFVGLVVLYLRRQKRKLNIQKALAEKEHTVAERLRQVDRIKDEFLANTSHELRTPLNGIIGLTESILDGAAGYVPPKIGTNLTAIASSGRRLLHLVNDILDISKLKSGSLNLDLKPVDLNALTDVVLTLTNPLAVGKSLTLSNRIPPGLPFIHADENRLAQILYNLVGNAIKFTEVGSVRIRAIRKDRLLVISVSDTGIGIPKEEIPHIFNMFKQVDGSAEGHRGGTGLGLAISRQLIQLHGGSIWVESEEGKGSTFTFELPISDETHAPEAKQQLSHIGPEVTAIDEQDDQEIPAAIANPANQRFNILIVDDDPINRQVFKNYLQLEGYRVQEATGGTSAFKLLNDHKVDLMLLDIMMPGMSGYQVCRKVRRRFSVHELPIIFLTAKNQLHGLVQGFEVGANDYLLKPLARNELIYRVKNHLQLLDAHRNLEKRVNERTEELVKTQKQMILQDKMASLGTLTAGVAHEINTPIGTVLTATSYLEEKVEELSSAFGKDTLTQEQLQTFLRQSRESLAIMMSHLRKSAGLITSFKQVAIDQFSEARRKFKVSEYLHEVLSSLNGELRPINHQVTIKGSVSLELDSYPGCLAQIITHLIKNSIIHGYKGRHYGESTIEFWKEGNQFHLRYSDDGGGISPKDRAKIFDPFFTTKRGSGQTGLGLFIVYNLISQKLGGQISCKNIDEGGVSFTMTFPIDLA